tara:strand:+ start:3541 stop:4197 length:657 start_codon:yes stop_codon:yes gene_type:complete
MSTWIDHTAPSFNKEVTDEQAGIFIHNPKAAGSSMFRSFNKYVPRMYSKHWTADKVKKKMETKDWSRLKKVGIVRNPWSRTFSLWNMDRKHWKHIKEFPGNFKAWLLEEYINEAAIEQDTKPHRPIVAQSTWFCDRDGNNLMDYIGKFEDLGTEHLKIYEMFRGSDSETGVEFEPLQHHNRMDWSDQNYIAFYDEEMKEFVEKKCQWEINKFGYKFGE